MKFALNGALTIGTLDGANVEIKDAVGDENIFIFGHTVDQVETIRAKGYFPMDYMDGDSELREVIKAISRGTFSPDEPTRYANTIQGRGDYYQALADFRSYVEAQQAVDKRYRDKAAWRQGMIANIAQMGYFSSDRSINDYAENIWHIEPIEDIPLLFK